MLNCLVTWRFKMHSTDYQTEANASGAFIYTTEQWFRAIQVRKMEYDRIAKPESNSSESTVLSKDFLIHRWLCKFLLSKIEMNSENLEIKPKKFKCIECNNRFDTYLENCLTCGANILKSEEIQKQATCRFIPSGFCSRNLWCWCLGFWVLRSQSDPRQAVH